MATKPDQIAGGWKSKATVSVTTAATGLSDIIDLGGLTPRSVEMSTAWTNANITFMGAISSTNNMKSVRHSTASTEVTYVTTAARIVSLNPEYFAGLRYIQVRSGSTATPVAQGAARTLYLGLTAVDNLD